MKIEKLKKLSDEELGILAKELLESGNTKDFFRVRVEQVLRFPVNKKE